MKKEEEEPLTADERKKLINLSRKLSKVLGFSTVPLVGRDAATGVFKSGSSLTSKSVRAAWSVGRPDRNSFKQQLLAALRNRPVSKP